MINADHDQILMQDLDLFSMTISLLNLCFLNN